MPDRSVVYRLIADASQGIAGVRAFGNEVATTAGKLTAVDAKQEKFRRGLDTTGRKAGQIGLIAAAGLGAFILKAANFDQAMSQVQAATRASADEQDQLRDAAIEAGKKTVFSATESADAITNLAKAGIATADILGEDGALNGALALAAAGELSVADAAEHMATALTQFKLPGEQATHVADLLAAGAGKAQGEVSDMALALDYAGVPASELDVSIEQLAGTVALFAKNGIVGEKAGTGLRGMLASLTSPSKVAKKTMDELGVSVFDNQGKFIGLDGVAAQLHDRLGSLTQEERANALGRIFGNEQLQAANVLYREGAEGVHKWTAEVDDAGFAAETARIKTDNLRGDLERLGGAIDSALITGGQGQQGVLREITQGLTGVVDGYGELPPAAQNAATGLLVAGAVAGGTIWAGAKLVRNITDIREGLAEVAPAGSKARRGFGLATKGLTALTVGLVAYNAAADKFGIGIRQDDLDRITAVLDAKAGPDIQAQIEATTAAIKEQQAIADEGFGVNLGVVKVFPFSQSAADAQDKVDGLQEHLKDLQAQLEINGANEAATEELNGMATAAEGAGNAIHFTEEQIKEARDAYQQQREDAAGVADSFFDISKKADKAKVSLGKWLTILANQAKALRDFTANVKKAKDNGLAQGFIDELAAQGPTGALRLQQLADASDEVVERANRVFRERMKAREAFINATTKKPVELKATATLNTDPADRQLALLKRKFLDSEKPVITEIKVENRQAMAGIRAVEQRLERLRFFTIDVRVAHQETRLGHFSGRDGGWTGDGDVAEVAGVVHGREFVVPAPYAARDRALLEKMYLPGYQAGGFVSPVRTAQVQPASATPPTLEQMADAFARVAGSGAAFIDKAYFGSNGDMERAERRARTRLAGAGGRRT